MKFDDSIWVISTVKGREKKKEKKKLLAGRGGGEDKEAPARQKS